MMTLFVFCPRPPAWDFDWEGVLAAFRWVREMAGVPQHPVHHGEGDVQVHTRMVVEELVGSDRWRHLEEPDREILFAAALLHDVGKVTSTRRELHGSIVARGHARRGAITARRVLWEAGVPVDLREAVCGLVRHHQVPFWALERPDPEREVARVAESARWGLLGCLAEADARGRVCPDLDRMLEMVELAEEQARLIGADRGPRSFPSDHTRFLYYRDPSRCAFVEAHDDTRSTVTMMVGLPGAGKDTWLAREHPGLPVVSLDDIRAELGVDPGGEQGRVVQVARDRAREHLRAGRSFAWNSTALSRRRRAQSVDLFAAYGARVEMVVVEAAAATVRDRNRVRPAPVPGRALQRMLDHWEMPDSGEAHRVRVVITD